MIRVMKSFEKMDMHAINWTGEFKKDLGFDSLERIALIASFEHEFTIVFEDRLFDNFKNLDQIKDYLCKGNGAI
jgi:NADH dehydrogenase (ubiquinone) 1 alpha/beta subcomplex 1